MAALAARVHAAHGDAWQAQGRLREPWGGGGAELPGIRVMASGLGHPRWNSGDVDDPGADVEAARSWYAARGVPWGVRVPEGMAWAHGRELMRVPLMALAPTAFRPAPLVAGLALAAATPADLDALTAVDAPAFGLPAAEARAWLEPHLHAPEVTTARATFAGELVATGWALLADGRGGPSVYIGGVAVAPHARRRGIGAALSAWLVQSGLGAGARLAVLQADTAEAARVYARLGFESVTSYDVYVDL